MSPVALYSLIAVLRFSKCFQIHFPMWLHNKLCRGQVSPSHFANMGTVEGRAKFAQGECERQGQKDSTLY